MWIHLVDPSDEELMEVTDKFNLDTDALKSYYNKSKNPEIRILENQTFTVMLDMRNKDQKTLETEGIYFFLGDGWLVTIHSSKINLKEMVNKIFKMNKKIKEDETDILYYNILAEIVSNYEQL